MPGSYVIGRIHLNHHGSPLGGRCRKNQHFGIIKTDIIVGNQPFSFVRIGINRKPVGFTERCDTNPFRRKSTKNRKSFQYQITQIFRIGKETFRIGSGRKSQ